VTLKDQVLAVIRQKPGITDSELVLALPGGSSRHQQINQRCRVLVEEGLVCREKRGTARFGNWPTELFASGDDAVLPQVTKAPSPDVSATDNPGSPMVAVEPTQVTVSFAWHSAGEVTADGKGGLSFPSLHRQPGIYRFRFMTSREVYVGEAVDLRRRMQNYKTPGPSQSTSIWMRQRLEQAHAHNEIVTLDVSTDVRYQSKGIQEVAPLSSKVIRLLTENAALLSERLGGWTVLNKAT
jgi:hypothetical protein